MSKRVSEFYDSSFRNFFEGIINLCFFLPYYFSVPTLLKTLFYPWKNIRVKKTQRGFTFTDFFNRLAFNLISIIMGLIIRLCFILVYLILQIILMFFIPISIVGYFLFFPILYQLQRFSTSEDDEKTRLKERFLQGHLLRPENKVAVEKWFEDIYQKKKIKSKWWKISNLYSIPPLGRDWANGYTPNLDDYSTDLTNDLYQANIKHIVGRDTEISEMERALSRSNDANILIVGEEGVGKHTVVDRLSKRVYEGKTNPLLMYYRILLLDMEKMLTQYTDSKQREEFFEELLLEAVEAKNVIVCIDNIDHYLSNDIGRVDLSLSLEKYAQSPRLHIIAITEPTPYEKYIESNSKISQLFAKLDIKEISKDHATEILLEYAEKFEHRFNVLIPYETILAAIEKSNFFITNVPFPEKATKLLDDACIYTTQTLNKHVVAPEYIDTVLSEKIHAPTTVSVQLKDKLLHLETMLPQKIIDQAEAVKEVSAAMRRAFLLLGKRKKPLASFLFLGPTGVGKTEMAKVITEIIYGSDKNLLRFDMSSYQTKADIPNLIGSTETNNPGLLTQAIRESPSGLLLLDEIEKADKDLLNIFLTVLDEGYFTDAYGKRVDCKNLIIVATSNAGAAYIVEKIKQNQTIDNQHNEMINYIVAQNIFSPEFLNRFDGVVTFNVLDQHSIIGIARKIMETVSSQIYALHKVNVIVSDQTLMNLAQKSYDPSYGARNMERVLRDEIEDKVAKMVLENKVKEGDTINF